MDFSLCKAEFCRNIGNISKKSNAIRAENKSVDCVNVFVQSFLNKAAAALITTAEGINLRMNRSIRVEGAFGAVKQDYAFRRFLTRGKRKTETQFFLIAFAFNVLKLWNRQKFNRFNKPLFEKMIA